MIKTIIKRNGSKEAFSAEKLNGWSQWAAEKLGKVVDWTEVVLNTVSTLPAECTSKLLQETLIQYCLGKNIWEYNLMAGKLYSALIVREVHGSDEYPTIKEVHEKMYRDGLMRKLDYTDAEYAKIEKMIDHSLNAKYPHYALHQNRRKYALQNKVTKKEYETSQHMYMRMAMAASEFEPKERRLEDVKEYYWTFANHKANVPTPFYVNLGTHLDGYASCCVFTTKDTAKSLAAADHITYMMTVMSAGIGYHIKTRSLGDPVRGGLIPHQGKLPYLTAYVGALGANLQNGRGGAGTAYMNFFDPEIEVLTKLKNPMTPLAKQIRGSDYSFGSNRLIVKKVATNEDIALFSYYDAPELYEAIYSGDQDYFEELYEEFLKSDKPRRMISARQIVLSAANESFETGRIYEHFTDHLNSHTPFKDKIYSGNLCVSGDTLIEFVNEDGDSYKVTVKNFIDNYFGKHNYYARSMDFDYKKECYSLIEDAGVTAYTDALYHIKTDTNVISCTPDHLVYVITKGYIAAKNIVNGDELLINAKETTKVTEVKVEIFEEKIPVYDIKVLRTECFFANDILVHNCVEIALPTAGFNTVEELYQPYDESKNFIKFLSTTDKEYNVYSWEYVTTQRGHMNVKDIRIGDEFVYHDQNIKVKKIIERSTSPEIALCNIGGIIVSNINSDEEYKRVAYRSLKLIRYGIHHSEYVFKNLEDTAKARMNAGVGIVGLAHLLAKKGLKYSSQEGKNFIHEIAETHYWHLVNAALDLSKEYGNAPWMYKTKWPEGWLPIDTYSKSVDNVVTVENKRDWESLRAKIIANKGIAFSVLAAMMPSESCCNFKTYILTEFGKMSLEEIFNETGLNIEDESDTITPDTGGKWYDLPRYIMVPTLDGLRPITKLWLNGRTNYIDIKLADGSNIQVTHHHKFVDENNEWVLAINLVKGQKIALINDESVGFIEITDVSVNDNKVITMDINVEGVHHYILENGVIAHNSSISGATTNGVYPIRELYLNKTNETLSLSYVAPDATRLKDKYESAWDVPAKDMTDCYAIIQKWTDQAISADRYRKLQGDEKVNSSEMLKDYIYRYKMGCKQSYYQNTRTSKGVDLNASEESCDNCSI